MATITSVSATFMLAIPGAVSQLTKLENFGTDDAFLMNVVEATEVQIGVDGFGIAGYLPRSPRHTIRLNAGSASISLFENWIGAMDVIQDVLYANATVLLPAVKRIYTCYMGSPMNFSTMADAKKVLQNREFEIQWLPQGQTPAITFAPTI